MKKKTKMLIILGFKNFIRDKRNIISIMLVLFTFVMTLLCVSFRESLNKYWNESLEKLINYRTFVVSFNQEKYDMNSAIEKVKTYEHVVESFHAKSYLVTMDLKEKSLAESGNVYLIGSVPKPVDIIIGSSLENADISEKPIICAKQFYPFIEDKLEDYVASKSIDITDLVGKNINMSFINSDLIEKFKIVGLYDAEANHTVGDMCYTSFDVVSQINDKYQYEYFNSKENDSNIFYMVIDSLNNKDAVAKRLAQDGFNLLIPTLTINKELGNNLISTLFIIDGIFIIITILVISYMFLKKISNRRKDYLMMKSIGYSNKQLLLMYFIEIVLILIASFLISIIMYNVIFKLFQSVFIDNKALFYNLNVVISYKGIFINSILLVIISFLSCLFFHNMIKKEY